MSHFMGALYNVKVVDPVADEEDLLQTYGIALSQPEDIKEVDAVIFAVPHEEFKNIELADVKKLYNSNRNGVYADEVAATLEEKLSQQDVLVDVKGIFDRKEAENMNFLYWRL